MTRFFAATGRFAVRFRWAVVAAWVAATVLASLLLPSLASVIKENNTDLLPASSPSLHAARLATPFQRPDQTPVLVVIARDSGTVTAADALVRIGPSRSPTEAKRTINKAIDAAAKRLNNTRAVCRKNYVDPRVPDSYLDGSLHPTFARARKRPRLSRAESGVLLLTDERPVLDVNASGSWVRASP